MGAEHRGLNRFLTGQSFAFILAMGTLLSACGDSEAKQESNPPLKEAPTKVEGGNASSEVAFDEENEIGEDLTEIEKIQLLSDFQSGKRQFDFYAVFTEPFWTVYFFGNRVMFVSMESEVPDVVPLEYPFADQEERQVLKFLLNSTLWELEVIKEAGSDGMSELNYPYSVKCGIYEGGGGTTFVKEN